MWLVLVPQAPGEVDLHGDLGGRTSRTRPFTLPGEAPSYDLCRQGHRDAKYTRIVLPQTTVAMAAEYFDKRCDWERQADHATTVFRICPPPVLFSSFWGRRSWCMLDNVPLITSVHVHQCRKKTFLSWLTRVKSAAHFIDDVVVAFISISWNTCWRPWLLIQPRSVMNHYNHCVLQLPF